MDNFTKKVDRFDWTLTLILFLFFLVSCVGIYSAQSAGQYEDNFLVRQTFWYVVGAAIISITILFDGYQYRRLSWYLYGFGLLLLIVILVAPESIAPIKKKKKSWFITPVGSIQP